MLSPIMRHRIVARVGSGRSSDARMYIGLRNAVNHIYQGEGITLGKTYVLAFQCQLNTDAVLFTSVLFEGMPDDMPLTVFVNVGAQEPRQNAIRAVVQFVARSDWMPYSPCQYALAYRFPVTGRKMDYEVVRFEPGRHAYPELYRNHKWQVPEDKELCELWKSR